MSVVKHALVSQLSEDDTSALVAALADGESDCGDTASVDSDDDPASDDEQDFHAAGQQ